MSIGILAISFAAFCGAVSLIGAAQPGKRREPAIDYTKIYRAASPKEI